MVLSSMEDLDTVEETEKEDNEYRDNIELSTKISPKIKTDIQEFLLEPSVNRKMLSTDFSEHRTEYAKTVLSVVENMKAAGLTPDNPEELTKIWDYVNTIADQNNSEGLSWSVSTKADTPEKELQDHLANLERTHYRVAESEVGETMETKPYRLPGFNDVFFTIEMDKGKRTEAETIEGGKLGLLMKIR